MAGWTRCGYLEGVERGNTLELLLLHWLERGREEETERGGERESCLSLALRVLDMTCHDCIQILSCCCLCCRRAGDVCATNAQASLSGCLGKLQLNILLLAFVQVKPIHETLSIWDLNGQRELTFFSRVQLIYSKCKMIKKNFLISLFLIHGPKTAS